MTIEQINLITFDLSNVHLILARLLDYSVLNFNESPYLIGEDDSISFYENILINSKLTIPTEAEIQSEIDKYKAELIVIENARIAEVNRVNDITDRFNNISSIRSTIAQAGYEIPNPAIELIRIIKENDQVRLTEYETSSIIVDSRDLKNSIKEGRKKAGKAARKVCEDILDLIAGFNIERSLTAEQVTAMMATFGTIEYHLRASRPWSAKPLIEAITPDEVIVTQEMVDDILEEFANSELVGL